MPAHKTAAWPLALTYALLVFYASLYPFSDWRDQGIVPWAFLTAPLPRYWSGFDVLANVLGYAPLGVFLALTCLRTGRAAVAWWLPVLVGAVLSLLMETCQSYLPVRVPSNVDLVLNVLGTAAGALVAIALEKVGVLDRWSRFRARWFVADARGALVLLALWPFALLFPAPVPLGLGQVLERLEAALAQSLQDTPFLDWLPVRDMELQPLVPAAELVCVALGLLIPCLLGYGVIRVWVRRFLLGGTVVLTGVGATALSFALSFGPVHAVDWLGPAARGGLLAGSVLAVLLLPLPRRGCAAIGLVAVMVYLSLLNHAPTSAYFAQTLQTWEQGRFIRFHGLAQWLGWLWPYGVLLYLLALLSARDAKN